MQSVRFFILLLVLCLSSIALPSITRAQTTQPPLTELPEHVAPVEFTAVSISMTTQAGQFPLFLEIASTPEQHARGLMFRPSLPDDYGMLFIFQDERPRGFWMENTFSPLDIIYIQEDGVVDSVVQGTPLSREALPSAGPVKFVLEVRQGLAQEYGLEPGTSVTFQ